VPVEQSIREINNMLLSIPGISVHSPDPEVGLGFSISTLKGVWNFGLRVDVDQMAKALMRQSQRARNKKKLGPKAARTQAQKTCWRNLKDEIHLRCGDLVLDRQINDTDRQVRLFRAFAGYLMISPDLSFAEAAICGQLAPSQLLIGSGG
jgi:hypothetical protein